MVWPFDEQYMCPTLFFANQLNNAFQTCEWRMPTLPFLNLQNSKINWSYRIVHVLKLTSRNENRLGWLGQYYTQPTTQKPTGLVPGLGKGYRTTPMPRLFVKELKRNLECNKGPILCFHTHTFQPTILTKLTDYLLISKFETYSTISHEQFLVKFIFT